MNPLRKGIADYLRIRRGLGYKLNVYERHLTRFVTFLESRDTPRITTQLAVEFATENPNLDPGGWVLRMSAIRGFARYWHGIDPASEIPPGGLVRCPRKRAKPRLCSDRELVRVLAAARQGALTRTRGLRPWTLYALFGLLAVTGMRVSEAVNLRTEDIDWNEGLLTIRDTKFGKSRRIPVHGSTLQILKNYARRRERHVRSTWRGAVVSRGSGLLFVSNRGTALSMGSLRWSFRDLQRKAGMAKGDCPAMRIHDLRHRFAVETLRRWYRLGRSAIGGRLPALSTFLGHVNVAATYWYLSSTPALRSAAIGRVESRWKGVADVEK